MSTVISTLSQVALLMALGLLAIVITVYVLAISLLGRAMKTARIKENQQIIDRRGKNSAQMAEIERKAREAKEKGELANGLNKQVSEFKKRDARDKRVLEETRNAPQLLTVKGGVVPASLSFLVAIILSSISWSLSDKSYPFLFIFVGAAILSISYGTIRVFKSLLAIENVAITSEAETEARLSNAVKSALTEVEELKKPLLDITWKVAPPFYMTVGQIFKFEYRVLITRGDIGKEPEVWFFVPKVFSFPKGDTIIQPPDTGKVSNLLTTINHLDDIKKGQARWYSTAITAPKTKGNFILYYKISCIGFDSGSIRFNAKVE